MFQGFGMLTLGLSLIVNPFLSFSYAMRCMGMLMLLQPALLTEADDGRYRGPIPSLQMRKAVIEVREQVNDSIQFRLGDMSPEELERVRSELGYTPGDPNLDSFWFN